MAQEKDDKKPVESVEAEQQDQGRAHEEPDPETSKDTESPVDNGEAEEPNAADSPESETTSETDPGTDKAVDDIVKKEGDDVLKAQDDEVAQAVVMKQSIWERFKNWNIEWWHNPRKRLISLAGITLVLAALFAVPFTRYNILGVALKTDVIVKVMDSTSGQPVSGATVELSGKTAETQANGEAKLHSNTGSGNLRVTKKYYTSLSRGELVSGNNTFKALLVATGHQVSIKLVDKVTGKSVSGATVTASGAKAKSNKQGVALLVIPSGATAQSATVTFGGYNDAKITIDANGTVAKNTFSLVPAGKLYFLSNLSGKIDVVKTNLDGTDRQTVLAGTGSEDKGSTSLLASRDWKYLALLSKRGGTTASVYLIDTTNGDKLTTIDEGNASFTLVGWSGDRFIYTVSRNGYNNWQPNQQALKSFDPTTSHTLLLDQTQGGGTGQYDYARQQFGNPYLIGTQVVYVKSWYGYGNAVLAGKSAELDSIGADGSGHKALKTYALDNSNFFGYANINLSTILYEPDGINIDFQNSNSDDFYVYDDGKVTTDTTMTVDKFNQLDYGLTYLLSPSGNSTFWGDGRDGKTTLLVGDDDAKNPKQIASLSDYNAYGWYTDNYLLVSKNSSELYIMPATGGTPQKITDYYKPAINYQGYGGGYGGL